VDLSTIRVIDVIDVLLILLLLYYIYRVVKGTVAINIFIGVVLVYAFWKLTLFLEMRLLSGLLGGFLGVGMFALIVLFQQEIRKFLLMLGSTNFNQRSRWIKAINKLFSRKVIDTDLTSIFEALEKMSISQTGALIVIQRNNRLDFLKETGDKMDIEVNRHIIENIFVKNSPLHDGAILIEGNRITATRLILPVSNNKSMPLRLGLRHRAALGITETTDAVCLLVSEETGKINYIKDGKFVDYKSLRDLQEEVRTDLG
jgi:diadenylate cyclase